MLVPTSDRVKGISSIFRQDHRLLYHETWSHGNETGRFPVYYESATLGKTAKYQDVLEGKINAFQKPVDEYWKI
jgi:hypothetical protein